MKPVDLMIWKRRAAFAYAMGVWTMLGQIIYLSYPEWFVFKTGLGPDEEVPEHLERRIHCYGDWTIVSYHRKDYVSLGTRISNYFKSSGGGSETKVDDE